jgi:hypothetical protein
MRPTCETCRHYQYTPGDTVTGDVNGQSVPIAIGMCRVNPPMAGSNRLALWALTRPIDWCGAFEPREGAAPTDALDRMANALAPFLNIAQAIGDEGDDAVVLVDLEGPNGEDLNLSASAFQDLDAAWRALARERA